MKEIKMPKKVDREREGDKNPIRDEMLFLLLKIVIAATLFALVFLVVFGVYRCEDKMMFPAFRDGDLIFYYRMQQEYNVSDVIVIEKGGETQARRIIAREGDVVDITEDGLTINGYLQQEPDIYTETLPYVEGIRFPLTVGEEEYFVLGDNRINAKDSRIYGTVKQVEIKGLVMTLMRRRGF